MWIFYIVISPLKPYYFSKHFTFYSYGKIMKNYGRSKYFSKKGKILKSGEISVKFSV